MSIALFAFLSLTMLLLAPVALQAAAPASLLHQSWFPKAPPLPKPTGEVIRVTTTAELLRAARQVKPGGTILIADGHYPLGQMFQVRTDNVTVRSESGNREKVVLDGQNKIGELFGFTGCHGVTVADLTIQNCWWNGFKLNTNVGKGLKDITIHNCVIHNIWQRGVKGVPGKPNPPGSEHPFGMSRNVTVRYCLFYNDRAKTWDDDPYEKRNRHFGGNYIGGMDIMCAKDWHVHDNVYVGIKGRTGGARGAIFIWNGSHDVLIERNIFIDCDRGVCMGNGHRPKLPDGKLKWPLHCVRFTVRNNFVCGSGIGVGILAEATRDCKVLHNTIHDRTARSGRMIRIVQDAENLLVANNLISGKPIRIDRHTGKPVLRNNLVKHVPGYFVDPAAGDLHLKAGAAGAIGKAKRLVDVPEDIDGTPRRARSDIGADEAAKAK
jgi:hypothetical protein